MMNSNAGGAKSSGDGTGGLPDVDDFDEMEKTVVLNDPDDDIDEDSDDDLDQTAVLDDVDSFTDNVGDVSVEINVEELLADLEANDDKEAARRREIRRRLEEAAESRSLDDTYALEFDEQSD